MAYVKDEKDVYCSFLEAPLHKLSLARILVEAMELPGSDSYANVATVCAMLSTEDIWWHEQNRSNNEEIRRRREIIEIGESIHFKN